MTGATALASIASGHHTFFATLLLGLLAIVMAHALVVEIQRQARRRSAAWGRHDTVNAVLLACWSLCAAAIVPFGSPTIQILGSLLAVGYAVASGYFVVERQRNVATPVLPAPTAPSPAESIPAVTDSTTSA